MNKQNITTILTIVILFTISYTIDRIIEDTLHPLNCPRCGYFYPVKEDSINGFTYYKLDEYKYDRDMAYWLLYQISQDTNN